MSTTHAFADAAVLLRVAVVWLRPVVRRLVVIDLSADARRGGHTTSSTTSFAVVFVAVAALADGGHESRESAFTPSTLLF